jgi:hypothetical protein
VLQDHVTKIWAEPDKLSSHVAAFYKFKFIVILLVVFKSRRLRWAGHVRSIEEERGSYRVLVRKPEGRNYLKDPGLDGRIILK